MDQSRLRRICENALENSFSGMVITDFLAQPTQKFDDEQNKWVPDSFCVFISIKENIGPEIEAFEIIQNENEVQYFLESLMGVDCCLDFRQNFPRTSII
jgi:hypothetical protein